MSWTIRPWDLNDVEGIVRVYNEFAPMHPLTVAIFMRELETLEPRFQNIIFVAEEQAEIVGVALMSCSASSYHPQRFLLDLGVSNAHRSKGIGTALYETTVNHLKTLDVLSISIQVGEENQSGLKFATKRGYVEQKRDFVSILDLSTFDPPTFSAKEQTVEIRSLQETDSPEVRRQWYELWSRVRHDVPRSEPATPLSFEFFEEQIVNEPDLVHSATLFAFVDSKMVGFTAGFHDVGANLFEQWLTGVDREFRGKHIALSLKVTQATEAKRLGIASVKTDNDTRNAPMLAVNDRLGFVRQPAVLSMKKEF
ncbi:MAG TPA: GNAT family N-acetyltransferase [Fimbriimonas sp.]|nr:GNAT family N-acetyltransferase [Fimbriimonas sp.]